MDPAPPPPNKFRADLVLSRSVSAFLNNIVAFLLVTAVLFSPTAIYAAVVLSGNPSGDDLWNVYYALALAGFVTQTLASAAVMYGTVAHLRAQRATTMRSVLMGLRRLLPALGVTILVTLCVFGGALLLVVPGVILLVRYWVAIPVAVVEKAGVTGSMKRSGELVAGEGWSIFAIVVLVMFVSVGLHQLLQQSSDIDSMTLSDFRVFIAVDIAVSVVTTAFSAVVTAVTYHDLRVAKDEISSEEIARAFLV